MGVRWPSGAFQAALVLAGLSGTASLSVVAVVAAADGSSAERVGSAVQREVVHVAVGARDELGARAASRLRVRIAERAPGRIRIAVVPESVVRKGGGLPAYANAVSKAAPQPGSLMVTTGAAVWIVTSWPDAGMAERAVRAAVDANPNGGLAAILRDAVDRLAAVDPGDAPESQPATSDGADDLVGSANSLLETLRLSVVIVALAVALPFLLTAGFLVRRAMRHRAREEDDLEAAWEDAQSRLLLLADLVTETDAFPVADAGDAPQQLLDAYEQAGRLLDGPPRPQSLRRALAALEAGERAGRALGGPDGISQGSR